MDKQAIKSELKRVFYPDKQEWKQAVWQQGRGIVLQALENKY
jgi:hypothetical protein